MTIQQLIELLKGENPEGLVFVESNGTEEPPLIQRHADNKNITLVPYSSN